MEKNQIKVKRIQTGTTTIFSIKNGMVYDARGRKNVYCSCTGKTVETATPMRYANGEVYCPHCHEKKVEVIQTYEEWKKLDDERKRKINEEKLQNLHIVEMGSDWECGFKYFGLSANIDYDDWLKVKKYFRYHKRGWSKGQELEWNYGEPTGWLTRNPLEVEKILVEEGLIKLENTMEEIIARRAVEKQRRELELAEKIEKKNLIKSEMSQIEEDINNAFGSNSRVLSDAEAYTHYYNASFGKGNVLNYSITDNEIIRCSNMGDFKYGIAIPFSADVENSIRKYYELENELMKV